MTFIGHGVRRGMWRTASVEICAPIIPDSRDTLGLVRKKKLLPGLFASVFIDTHTSLICVWLCQGLSESDRKKRGHSELWLYRQSTSSEPIHPQSSRPSRQHRLPPSSFQHEFLSCFCKLITVGDLAGCGCLVVG